MKTQPAYNCSLTLWRLKYFYKTFILRIHLKNFWDDENYYLYYAEKILRKPKNQNSNKKQHYERIETLGKTVSEASFKTN